ncbi:hypothetical protein [Viridibacterium curvum]|uniref:Uncharacterized protein n=1 Tax=Viridibacterium curvum TaxID=1101404 RepID=A0ABP9Q9B7_9RHOO
MDAYTHPFYQLLLLTCMLGWLISYVVIIRRGIKDRACGMPLVPLCINLSWEFIFGFMHPDLPPANYVCMAYFVLDLGIVWTYFKYGREEMPALLPRALFIPAFLLVLAMSFAGVLAVTYHFNDWTGSYTGWGDNFLIPCALIAMLLRRGNTRGQSMYVAVLTWLASIALVPFEIRISPDSLLLNYLYVGFIVFGAIYIVLLYRTFKAEGKQPWQVW